MRKSSSEGVYRIDIDQELSQSQKSTFVSICKDYFTEVIFRCLIKFLNKISSFFLVYWEDTL